MDRVLRFTGGFFLGAAVAAGLVLLYAPQSGLETQQSIQDYVQEVLEEGRQTAETRRLELSAQFEALKKPQEV
ncbi:MAG: YtxH domain-containing protein [Anaerolineae bacterium]